MRLHLFFLGQLIAASLLLSAAQAQTLFIEDVTILDVEDGGRRAGQSLLVKDGRIASIGDAASTTAPANAQIINGAGKFLIPGLWDMHVHSHREERWKYHYPLFLAHGVLGVRDAGTHLGSALAAMEWTKHDPLAPEIIWGSPIIDGAPQVNSFGLSAEDEASARALVREMKRRGFAFVKVYDRLSPDAYRGLADEARRQGMPLEGHVPLALSPQAAIDAGQSLIDHLTLVLESCTPGALDMVHEEFSAAPAQSDSLALMMDARLADALGGYDAEQCAALFESFAGHDVAQVPTLIEMRGFFFADDPAVANDPRIALTTPTLLADWREFGASADPKELANGRKVFAAQMRMIPAMQEAGVLILAGTDTSSEPWVFAGASLHDELALMVEAGLSPLQALQTATINPLVYRDRKKKRAIIARGEKADLLVLNGDPLASIAATRAIEAVIKNGVLYDRAALGALIERAKSEAAKDRR